MLNQTVPYESTPKTILICGSRAPVALDLISALTACGHRVHAADVRHNRALKAQGLILSQSCYAAPARDYQAFGRDIEALCARLKPDMVLALCEEIFALSHLSPSLNLPLFAPTYDRLMCLHSKYDFIEWAKGLGLKVPHTERLENASLLAPQSVYKPEFSRFGTKVLIRPRTPPDPSNHANMIVQAYVEGRDLSFYAIAHKGRITAFSAYESAWRTKGGASYYFSPLDDDLMRRILVIAERLAMRVRLSGQLACDLRLGDDGTLWLIECNPRATSGLHLLAHDPKALERALFDTKSPIYLGTSHPAMIGPAMLLLGLPRALSRGQFGLWQRDYKRARDALGTGVQWYGALLDSLDYAASALMKGQSFAEALTEDIRCDAPFKG